MNIDIVEAKGTTTKLTVTPTRITLKLPKGTELTNVLQLFIGEVLLELGEVTQSWRGAIKYEVEYSAYSVCMATDGNKLRKSITRRF